MKRRVPVKKINASRKAAEFDRAYGGSERAEWVTRQPSVVSGVHPCVNAHVRTGGVSRKADARWVVPLTPAEHDELHRIGKASFEAAHHIDLDHEAAITDARWEQYVAAHPKTPSPTPLAGEGLTQ